MLRGGIAWRLMPDSFPPWRAMYRWFARFRDEGTWETINYHLVMQDRERVDRAASPSAAVIDSQSVMTTESTFTANWEWARLRSPQASALRG